MLRKIILYCCSKKLLENFGALLSWFFVNTNIATFGVEIRKLVQLLGSVGLGSRM